MAHPHLTSRLDRTEEAITVLFCLVDLAQPPLARGLRRFLEPLRRAVVSELVGEPETLIVDSTPLECRTRARSSGRPQASTAPRG